MSISRWVIRPIPWNLFFFVVVVLHYGIRAIQALAHEFPYIFADDILRCTCVTLPPLPRETNRE